MDKLDRIYRLHGILRNRRSPISRAELEERLYENDIVECARTGGAGEDQWLRLAQICEQTRPQNAAEICRQWVGIIADRKTPKAYEQAAAIVDAIRRLMSATGEEKAFGKWFTELVDTHKAKQDFMKKLTGLGLI